jgi:hypothetical protein
MRLTRRLVRFDFRLRKWPTWPLVRINLPLPVLRKRFAVALWVFILYFLPFFFLGLMSTSFNLQATSRLSLTLWPSS